MDEPKQPQQPTEVKVVVYASWSGLTKAQWLASDDRISWFRRLWQDAQFQEVISVLQNERPIGYPLRGEKLTPDQIAVELGRKEGYEDCLRVIRSLLEFPVKPPPDIEPTYTEEAPFVGETSQPS